MRMKSTESCITEESPAEPGQRSCGLKFMAKLLQKVGRRYGVNFSSTISWVSWEAGSHFHCRSASSADWTSKGWPPFTSRDFTFPFGATNTSALTLPCILKGRARPGYCGTVLVTTLRLASAASWAEVELGTNNKTGRRASKTGAIRFFMGITFFMEEICPHPE